MLENATKTCKTWEWYWYQLCAGTVHEDLRKKIRITGSQRKNQDHPIYSSFEISHNTEESPWDRRRLGRTRNPDTQVLKKTHKDQKQL